jgi:hypothetical protein
MQRGTAHPTIDAQVEVQGEGEGAQPVLFSGACSAPFVKHGTGGSLNQSLSGTSSSERSTASSSDAASCGNQQGGSASQAGGFAASSRPSTGSSQSEAGTAALSICRSVADGGGAGPGSTEEGAGPVCQPLLTPGQGAAPGGGGGGGKHGSKGCGKKARSGRGGAGAKKGRRGCKNNRGTSRKV